MTRLIYHSPSKETAVSPFDDAILHIADGHNIKIVSPYIGLSYLKRLIDVSTGWQLISDIEAWLSSLVIVERYKAWEFIQANIMHIHHYPSIHAKTVINADSAYVGSANLTTTGILARIEMGVLIESHKLVNELNEWFDNIWNLSSSPDIEQGIRYLQKMEGHQISTAEIKKTFSSKALQVRAKLLHQIQFEKASIFNSNKNDDISELSKINLKIPTSKLDEYIYRIILAFDFENGKTLPKLAQMQSLTNLNEREQTNTIEMLVAMGFIMLTEYVNQIPAFRLNEDFEWDSTWLRFTKSFDCWERKISKVGRKVNLPKDMVIIQSKVGENLVELTPGEDHAFLSNIAFADAIYAKLCESLANNGGMLPMPSLFLNMHSSELHPLAFTITELDDSTVSKSSLYAISDVLDECVDGLPPSPFKFSLVADAYLIKNNNGYLPKYPMAVTLKESINPNIFPMTAKAAELATLQLITPGQFILTSKQVNLLNRKYAEYLEDAKGALIENDVLDSIYAVIANEACAHANKMPFTMAKFKEIIVAKTHFDQATIDLAFHKGAPTLGQLLRLTFTYARAEKCLASITCINLTLLSKYPKTNAIIDANLIANIPFNSPIDWPKQQGIALVGRKLSLSMADLIYEKFIEMQSYWGVHIPIQEVTTLYKMIADKAGVKPRLVADVLQRRFDNLPKVFYIDAGSIQKGMTFVFLNGLLSGEDWSLLPRAKLALAKVNDYPYIKLL